MQEVLLIIVNEVENERGTILELYQQALPKREIPPLQNSYYFNQRPILLNGLVLSKYKGCELQVGIFLVGGNVLEST
jgi:dTDP-4-dehydrorhamnose 3,5-epimerase-like enzyme